MLEIRPPEYKFCPFCGNELDEVLMEGRQFKHCEKDNWTYFPHVGQAACGVAVRDGKVLLVKRAREPYKGSWMFPAGFVSFGEHPSETVVRELEEETGYKAKVIKLLDIIQVDDDPRSMGHFGFFYDVSLSGEMILNDKEENLDIDWFDLNDLPEIGWHSHKQILSRLGGVTHIDEK